MGRHLTRKKKLESLPLIKKSVSLNALKWPNGHTKLLAR